MYVGCAGGPLFDNKYYPPHKLTFMSRNLNNFSPRETSSLWTIIQLLIFFGLTFCLHPSVSQWRARVICEPSVPVNIQNQRRQISSTLQHNRTTFSNLRSSEACTDVLTVRMWKWRLRLKVCAIMKLKTPALATIAGAETATWNPRQDCCGYQDAEERDDHDGSPENDIHLPLPRPCGGGQPPLPRPI